MGMHRITLVYLLILLLLLVSAWTVSAEGNETSGQNGGNVSHAMIFSFTNATLTETGSHTMTAGTSNLTSSAEEYYNQLAKDSDTEPLHLNIQGIPMECHFCR